MAGILVSSTNKTDRHDITEILLKVALNTINQTKPITAKNRFDFNLNGFLPLQLEQGLIIFYIRFCYTNIIHVVSFTNSICTSLL